MVAISVREREQGRFRGSIEGAQESTEGARASTEGASTKELIIAAYAKEGAVYSA